jgi:Spy/CpxP family protein refolding chaperone
MAEEAGSRRGTQAEVAKAAASPQPGSPSQRVVDSDFDMGSAMMPGDNGAFGMGTGMTDHYLSGADLNLTADQRGKIATIQARVRVDKRDLLAKMQTLHSLMNEQYASEPHDAAALSKSYRRMSELREQMFDLSLGAQDDIRALLSQAQRDALKNQ